MKFVNLVPVSVALALSLAACDRATVSPDAAPAAEASAADADSIKQTDTALIAAIAAKDVAAIKAHYADDAVMALPGQAPFKGIAAITADYEGFAADPAGKFAGTNESNVVSSGGDLGYAQGTYRVTFTNPETKTVETADRYYVLIYKKQPDGSWKVVQDLSVPLPAAG